MRLLVSSTIPSTTSQNYPVATWPVTTGTTYTDPTYATGITAIAPLNDPIYSLATGFDVYAFDQFILPDSVGTSYPSTTTLGIFIYTLDSFASGASVNFKEISLVPNNFAIASNPKTYNQVLQDCQYYYESNFSFGVYPGDNNYSNAQFVPQAVATVISGGTTTIVAWPSNFNVNYRVKRAVPALTLYNVSSSQTPGSVTVRTQFTNASVINDVVVTTYWDAVDTGNYSSAFTVSATNSFGSISGTTVTNLAGSAGIVFNYIADARIG
ncbi:unnamed protein product [Sphagnum jensenii]|uniref:Uncharacterized protein n=1 Tax=Sphagnum jensenii TaxID=128206 RepID=A0ABP0VHK2_9BRYO